MGCGTSTPAEAAPHEEAAPQEEAAADGRRKRRASATIIQRRALDFSRLMDDAEGTRYLMEFAEAEHSEENLLLFQAILKFKRAVTTLSGEVADAANGLQGVAATDAAAARDEQLAAAAAAVIDTYLCDGAELQVTLPDKESKAFKKRAAQALKKVAVTSDMFDKISRIAYAQIRDDIFKRFKLSDQAAELAILRPQLCTGADDQPQSNTTVQRELRRLLSELQAAIGFERATVWMLDGADDDASLWSVCSTELGNSVIGIRKDRGLVGKAVTLVEDVTIDDAYSDPAFNQRVDKATSFLTKSVCCCVLQEGGEVRAVVQMLNKKDDAAFDAADREAVHAKRDAILERCGEVVLHKLVQQINDADAGAGAHDA